jgi:drug/metabolite transporter (DMT)-like permease
VRGGQRDIGHVVEQRRLGEAVRQRERRVRPVLGDHQVDVAARQQRHRFVRLHLVQRDLERRVRVVQAAHGLRRQAAGGGGERGDRELAGDRGAARVELGLGLRQHRQRPRGVRREQGGRVGEADAAPALLEQALADFLLEAGDLLRHRRRRDVEDLRRRVQRAVGRDRMQGAQPLEVHHEVSLTGIGKNKSLVLNSLPADLAGMATTVVRPAGPAAPSGAALFDFLYLVIPGVIWGASFLFIAEGLTAIGPAGVTFVRILVGFAALSFVPAARRAVPRADWGGVAWLGLLWFALPLSAFPFAQQHVSSALAGMLNGAVPIATAIVAALVVRRAPSRGVTVGLGVGLGGAVLVALPSWGQGGSSLRGVLLILGALASYGVALNVARPLQQRHGALPVVWRGLGFALLLTAPLGLPDLLNAHWRPLPLLALLALGAGGTCLAQVMVATAAGRLGPTKASVSTFLIPPVALVLGVAVRGEQVAALSVVGGAVCVLGAWLVRRAQSQG